MKKSILLIFVLIICFSVVHTQIKDIKVKEKWLKVKDDDANAVDIFAQHKKYYTVKNFKIGGTYEYGNKSAYEYGGKGGVTLESLGLPSAQMAYIELGKPHHNEKGEIDNSILICPYYSGDSTNMLNFWWYKGERTDFSGGVHIGPGKLFDTNKYYIILADGLGLWGASKPSSSNPGQKTSYALGLDFPQYRLEDCVQLMYRLLKDKLNVNKLKLATGVSMGGTLTYGWGVLHPEYVEAIMPIGGTPYQNIGMGRWIFDLMTSAIQSDTIYRKTKGYYYDLPKLKRPIRGNMFGWSIIRHSAFVDEFRVKQDISSYKLEAFDWEESQKTVDSQGKISGYSSSLYEISLIDANDLIYRNRAQANFNVVDKLHRIKAKTLIIHISTDQWLKLHLAKTAQEKIPNAKLISFPDDKGHYAVFKVPAVFKKEIKEFLKQVIL